MADPQPPGWVAIAGALTALYAATLSTTQFVRSLRDERPRIEVTLRLGRVLNVPGDKDPKLFVTYVNVGKIAVSVPSLPAIRISDMEPRTKLVLHSSKYPLPMRLETYSENESWVNIEKLTEYIDWKGMEKGRQYWIAGSITDASGKKHQSVPHVLLTPAQPATEIEVDGMSAKDETAPTPPDPLPPTLELRSATRLQRMLIRIGCVPRVR
jgi:hypothetical protein